MRNGNSPSNIEALKAIVNELQETVGELQAGTVELQGTVIELQETLKEKDANIHHLTGQLNLFKALLHARKSEKKLAEKIDPKQMLLFDEAEAVPPEEDEEINQNKLRLPKLPLSTNIHV